MGLNWISTKKYWPGNHFMPEHGYETINFVVIYHHGDDEMMMNMAFWDGNKFIIGTTCYCDECSCDCRYRASYSDECHVTHWAVIDLPEFEMGLYFDEN